MINSLILKREFEGSHHDFSIFFNLSEEKILTLSSLIRLLLKTSVSDEQIEYFVFNDIWGKKIFSLRSYLIIGEKALYQEKDILFELKKAKATFPMAVKVLLEMGYNLDEIDIMNSQNDLWKNDDLSLLELFISYIDLEDTV
jgi:hypothetical protein